VLLHHDADGLAACYHDELRLLERISHIQSAWDVSAVEYLQTRGTVPSGAVTIDIIAELLPEDDAKNQLLRAKAQLADLVSRIKRANLANRQLIARTLHNIDYIVELYRSDGEQDVTYHNPAARYPSAASSTKRFESRA